MQILRWFVDYPDFLQCLQKQSEHVITILIRKNLIFNCSWLSYWIEGGWARLSKIGSSQRELQQIRRNVHIDKFFGSHWALNTVHQLNPYRKWCESVSGWTLADLTDVKMMMSGGKSYLVIKVREVKIVKEVMACDVLPVALFDSEVWMLLRSFISQRGRRAYSVPTNNIDFLVIIINRTSDAHLQFHVSLWPLQFFAKWIVSG